MPAEREGYAGIADALQQPVWTVAPDGTVTYANPFWQAYTGLSRERALGSGWADAVHPEDVEPILAAWRAAAPTGAPYEIRYRLRRADDAYRWHAARVSPLHDASGAFAGWAASAVDIDDRLRANEALQASEARYRALVDNANDIIYSIDLHGRVLAVNGALERVLGYRPEEMLGRSIEELLVPDQLGHTRRVLDRKLTGETHSVYELEVLAKDGQRVVLEINTRLVDLPGQPPVIHGIARDVSERNRFERVQRDFLAMVTHDLRNPLTTIKGRAQLLRRRVPRDDRVRDGVEGILAQVEHMERLIDDLADLVRVDAGQLQLHPAPVDLVALAREQAELAQEQTETHRLRVETCADSLIGVWDPHRLGQVLQNLLTNAVKYSPDGGDVAVRVGTAGTEARIAVADQGIGIAPEQETRIFERFYQADAMSAGGLGLGLHISRMLVEAQGGRIEVASTPGAGSTFTVVLPLAAASCRGR